ncbi:MAG TPA: hypothetical protein VJA21_09320 [Verrucomicrobiae bacterium]
MTKTAGPDQPHINAAEFEAQLRASMDDLMVKTRTHQDAWGLGKEVQWCLDEGSGELVLTFPDSVVSAPAQVIGKFDSDLGDWTWAWADESLPENLRADAMRVHEYGMAHGYQHLVVPTWQAEESHCWYMTALACALCEASGAYRGVSGDIQTFVIYRNAVATPLADPEPGKGTTEEDLIAVAVEEFKACPEDADQQRQVCCRYLKRGALAGLEQDELIHRLGLEAPSVLDRAGYSAELSDNVMGMLKTISDQEIFECVT